MTKTFSFALLHFTVAFLLGWLFTGSLLVGGALALVEPACNTVVCPLPREGLEAHRTQTRRAALGPLPA